MNKTLGAGAVTAGVVLMHQYIMQKPIIKPVFAVLLATSLLAALGAVGLASVAEPMAMLVAISVIGAYGVSILSFIGA